LKHFAVVTDGEKISKYDNPKHIAKHEKNLKRKQQKLARKQKGVLPETNIVKLSPKCTNEFATQGKIFCINLAISWSAIAKLS
jgi:hypothetical protein